MSGPDDTAEARAFPYGGPGDVRFDSGQMELVMIEECKQGPKEGIWTPTRIGAVRQLTTDANSVAHVRLRYEMRLCNKPEQLLPLGEGSDLAADLFKFRCESVKAMESIDSLADWIRFGQERFRK